VQTIKQVLLTGENFIGDYNVEIARWKDGEWSAMIPPLYMIMTDRRIVLQAHSRKHYEPAIIPAEFIDGIQEFTFRYRHGIILILTTEQKIGLFIPNLRHDEIINNMHTISAPTKKPDDFEAQLDMGSLQKLIDYVSGL
jgi:hypothetical protein